MTDYIPHFHLRCVQRIGRRLSTTEIRTMVAMIERGEVYGYRAKHRMKGRKNRRIYNFNIGGWGHAFVYDRNDRTFITVLPNKYWIGQRGRIDQQKGSASE